MDRKLTSVTGLIRPAKAADLSFAEYFRRYPANVPSEDRFLARGLVEGFEAATMEKISARSLSGEFLDDGDQCVVPGGYDQLVQSLVDDCASSGVRMIREMAARFVAWRRGRVRVEARDSITNSSRVYAARAAVITLPLGVLKAHAGLGAVRFCPGLHGEEKPNLQDADGPCRPAEPPVQEAGMEAPPAAEALRKGRGTGFGFIHSDAKGVPVWWSHSDEPIMVGWAGGPAAKTLIRLAPAAPLGPGTGFPGQVVWSVATDPSRRVGGLAVCRMDRRPLQPGRLLLHRCRPGRERRKACPAAQAHPLLRGGGDSRGFGEESRERSPGALRSGIRAAAQVRRALRGP